MFSAAVIAVECVAVFSDGIQNNSNSGELIFGSGSKVTNSPDNVLDSKNAINDLSGGVSCDSTTCSSSGSITSAVNYNDFPNSSDDILVAFEQTQSISPGNYNNITLASSATLNLAEGDYTLKGSLAVGFASSINISGKVRIFVKKTIQFNSSTSINVGGTATDLLLYAKEDFYLLSSATVTAFVYSKQDVTINSSATVNGAVSGRNVELVSASTVNFISDEPDFGDFCESTPAIPAQPFANYRFDETEYTDTPNEIIDSIGSFHGQAKASQPVESGKVCSAIDLSATGIDNYAILDETILTGKTDFSVSLWAKTSKTSLQSILSGAGTTDNELIMLFTNQTHFRPFLKNSSNGDITTPSIADNNWHHLVWTREGSQSCLFVDKVQQGCVSQSTSSLDIQSLILGQEQDNIGGGFDSSQAFDGLLDELLVFDSAITAAQVATIYDNQDAGLGYDGTARSCPTPTSVVLNMRFDENSWSGAAGEVIDETGSFNGQAVNDPSTVDATPAIVGNPGTCGYGVFDGVDDYVALPASFENQQDSFTITAWINPSNLDAGSRVLADDENNSQGYALSLGDPGSGKLRFYSRGVSPISVDTQSSVIPVDTWTFVAAVHNSVTKTRIIYVNGVAQTVVSNDGQVGLSNTYSGSWGVDTGIASIGGETDSGETANRFTGAIDEVRMYQGALTSAEIVTIQNETHACTIDHFEIAHDGQGLTCEAENITIKACADAACSILSTDDIDVQLSINGTFDKTVTVSGGSTDSSFSYTDASTATLSLDQTYECANGGSTSCDVVFADTGFRFYADSEGTSIPTQLSGKPSNIGFKTSTLKLQAVKKDPLEGDCDAALTDSVIVELSASCKNPNACLDGEAVTINSLSTDTVISTQNDGAAAVYTDVAMDFATNTDNDAEFVFTYPEAGQMQLHARYNIPDENGDPSGVYMEGSSNNFVVRPLGFYVNVANNPKAQDATGAKFIAAGEDFATSLTAVQWQSGWDDNDDGILDDDAVFSSYTITKNFGNESAAEAATAEIEKGLVAPSLGSLDNTVKYSFTSFVNGVATNSAMTYDEVGIISFTATAASYLGADDVIGKEPYVGRFIPHHFELTSFTVENSCGDFTYMDEPNLNFTYEITAQTKGDETTLNYVSSAVEGNNFVNSTVVFVAENDNDGIDLSGRLTNYQGAWDLGVYANEDNTGLGDDLGQFTRAIDYDGPYDNLLIGVMLTDTDESALENLDMKVTSNNDCEADCDAKQSFSDSSQIRFGRWQIENTFGSERSDLPFSMAVQYYDGSNFVTNTLDTCTTFDGNTDANYTLTLTKRDLTALDNPLASIGLTSISGSGTFADGVAELEIGMPSDGSQGQIRLTYDATPTWLKYDWDWNGVETKTFNENPSAVATFGLFRGNDRIIYQREVH